MRYKLDADIVDHNEEKVGELQHVVLNPVTHEITHLVVRKGWLFKADKVLPESLVANANDEAIQLYDFDGSLDDMPDYEDVHYVPYNYEATGPNTSEPIVNSVLIYPPVRRPYGSYPAFPQQFQQKVVEKNIPSSTIAIEKGATLVDLEGEEIGEITELIATATDDRATDIVFEDTDGVVKRIPIQWVQDMHEDSVRLAVSATLLSHIPEHHIVEPA